MKRVKKFVNYAIDVTSQDKKAIKLQMDNAFEDLKRKNYRAVYQERYMFALIFLYVSQRYCGHVSNTVAFCRLVMCCLPICCYA